MLSAENTVVWNLKMKIKVGEIFATAKYFANYTTPTFSYLKQLATFYIEYESFMVFNY